MIRETIQQLATWASLQADRLGGDEEGATAIEYGLIAALIAVVLIAALTAVGTELQAVFQSVADALTGA